MLQHLLGNPMLRLFILVIAAASVASMALAAPGSSIRPALRPGLQVPDQPSAPTVTPGGSDTRAGLAQRDLAIQQMRATASLQEAPATASVNAQHRLTVFAPGGEQILKSLSSTSPAGPQDAPGAREGPSVPAAEALGDLQPGVRSLDGRTSQGRIAVGVPGRLVVAGFAPQSVCGLDIRVLSRALPDIYALHQDDHLRLDLKAPRLPSGAASAPGPSGAKLPPLREIPVTVVGGDATRLCQTGSVRQPVRMQAYSLDILIPEVMNAHRTGGFEDDLDAIIEVVAADGTAYQMTGVTLVAKREPLVLQIYRTSPLQATYQVNYGDWKPLGVAPYRFTEGQSLDCPEPGGGDHVKFTGLKHGFTLVSADMLTDRVDTGDGDGYHNPGSRVMLGAYGLVFDGPSSFWANWGVWRSHRSEVGITSGMGAVVDVRPAHDICLSNYYLSVTLVGPMDMTPW
jgi:hypothetical protein